MRKDWVIRKLGELGAVVGGSTPKTNVPSYWGEGYYWITPAELDGSKYVGATARTITDEALKHTNLSLLPVGTVLLSSRAPIGKVAITTSPMFCNQGFKNIICGPDIYNEYVYWFLIHNKDYLVSLGRGATFKEISKSIVEQVTIPIPPFQKQVKIAAELNCLSKIIEKKKRQLEELDKLAQSIFYDMFGDPITNEKGWEMKKLGDEFGIASGGTPSTKENSYWENGTISWIGSNMCHNEVIYENDGKFITEAGLNNSSARLFRKGFVLVALVGATIGKVALIQFETTTNQNIAGIDVPANKCYTSFFVFYLIQCLYCLFESIGEGKFKMANLSFVRSLPLIAPPIDLQNEFSEKIEAIEKQKELVKRSIVETETLFNSRMDFWFNN